MVEYHSSAALLLLTSIVLCLQKEISRICDGIEAVELVMGLRLRQENLRQVFKLFSFMRSLTSIRLKQSVNDSEMFLSRPQPHL